MKSSIIVSSATILVFLSSFFVYKGFLYGTLSEKKNARFQNNWQSLNLRGKVKSIVCTKYDLFVSRNELVSLISRQDYWFDPEGNVAEEKVYLEDQSLHYRRVYSYDKMGNYLRFDSYKENNKFKYRGENRFNEEGRRTVYQESNADGQITYKEIYDYTKITNDQIVYTSRILIPLTQEPYTYVEDYKNGNMIRETRYFEDSLINRSEFKYDKRNNLRLKTEYKSDTAKVHSVTSYRYDLKGRLVYRANRTIYDKAEVEYEYDYDYDYDAFDNIIFTKCIRNGQIDQKYSCRNEYVYDDRNNWIKRSTFKLTGEPKYTLERKIDYY